MKNNLVRLLSIMAAIVVSHTGCVNDGLGEPEQEGRINGIASLQEQAASMQATVSDVEALQEVLENEDPVLADAIGTMKEHILVLKGSADWTEATLGTFAEQKSLAVAIGAVSARMQAADDGEAMDRQVRQALRKVGDGAESWLGKNLDSYYPAMVAKKETEVLATGYRQALSRQKISVEGLASDIEAGLKEGVAREEIDALAENMDAALADAEAIEALLSATVAEVEETYGRIIATAAQDPDAFDQSAAATVNRSAASALAETETTLSDLAARVQACESALDDLNKRVTALEGKIDDLEELLDLIQSVTFMSEYSEENAIAYYTLDDSGTTSEGYMLRDPESSIRLSYIVRPASAATALAQTSLWNNEVKAIGYYADAITKAPTMFDYHITGITASSDGIINVTLDNNLKDDFFYKRTGAKLALSIAVGKTDLTTKFVEVVPKNRSGLVYVDDISLSAINIELDDGQEEKLIATVNPSDVYNKNVIWSSSDSEVASVAQDGTISAKKVGNAVITATSEGTNEWGQKVNASCTVKVNSSIKINGPDYVELGEEVKFEIQSPTYISEEYITWEIGILKSNNIEATDFASVDEDGTVHGNLIYYDISGKEYTPLTLRCTIAGADPIVLTHPVRIIAVQPKNIKVENLADTDGSLTMKLNQGKSLAATMLPEDVDESLFRITYTYSRLGFATIDENGWLTTNSNNKVGTETIKVSVQPIERDGVQYDYTYPKGSGKFRNINVTVEPYYVTGISFKESGNVIGSGGIELASGGSTSITPVFTSDGGDGVYPTFASVTWTSSNPSAVTVDENGTIKAVSDENGAVAYITAETSNSMQNAYKKVSSTFKVTVTKAWLPFSIGDYVLKLSDGSIGFCSNASSKPSGSTIVGVVISNSSPRASDTKLPADCTHGLAVGLNAFTATQWWSGFPSSPYYQSVDAYANANGFVSMAGVYYSNSTYYVNGIGSQPYGYNNTKALSDYIKIYVVNNSLGVTSDLLNKFNNSKPSAGPTGTSEWYMPSIYELKQINANISTINSALSAAGGEQLANRVHWTVSEVSGTTSSNVAGYNPMTNAITSKGKTGNGWENWPCRYILAF